MDAQYAQYKYTRASQIVSLMSMLCLFLELPPYNILQIMICSQIYFK